MDPLPWHSAAVWREQEDFLTSAAGRADHAFTDSESHLARGEICHDNDQPADETIRCVGALDAGEDIAVEFAAQAQSQLNQLIGSLDVRGRDDSRDAEVDLRKIVDRTQVGDERFLL